MCIWGYRAAVHSISVVQQQQRFFFIFFFVIGLTRRLWIAELRAQAGSYGWRRTDRYTRAVLCRHLKTTTTCTGSYALWRTIVFLLAGGCHMTRWVAWFCMTWHLLNWVFGTFINNEFRLSRWMIKKHGWVYQIICVI